MPLALLLACRLVSLEPPTTTADSADPASDSASDYAAALAEIERLNIELNREPEAHQGELALALDRLTRFAPQLADDPEARELRLLALLNLARAMLLSGDEQGAGLAMDEAIRVVRGDVLPVAQFGPSLAEFHTTRREALAKQGTGRLQVECEVACRVLVDELELELDPETRESQAMLFGSYRVWIESRDLEHTGGPAVERHLVEIDEDGEVERLVYAPPAVERPVEAHAPPRRLLPRWAEITGAAVGVGLVVLGGSLLSFDGRCPGGQDPIEFAAQCPKVYESSAGGISSVAIGAALALSGGVLLTIDEVRLGKQRGAQVMVGYTFRF